MKLEMVTKLENTETKNILATTEEMLELHGEEVLPFAFTALLATLDETITERNNIIRKLALASVFMNMTVEKENQKQKRSRND